MLPLLLGVALLPAADPLDEIGAEVHAAIARQELPGAVVLILKDDRVIFRKAFGHRSVIPGQPPVPMTADTVFDLASLTKPIATASAIILLNEHGKLTLDDPVAKHWPAFAANGKEQVTIAQCLLHTSGLTPDNALADYRDGRDKALERVAGLKLDALASTRLRYSDVGYVVLGHLVERLSGLSLDRFATDNLFKPLAMNDTSFLPPEALRGRCAPTTQVSGKWLTGMVHDSRARLMGGVAGHAGLFGTADDLAVFARMLLAGGELKGRRVLRAESVELLTKPRPVPGGFRTYGWDVDTAYSGNRGSVFPRAGGFGHTGFTGTSIWADRASKAVVIFLSNRVHPDEKKGNVNKLRGTVATLAARAIGAVK